MNVYLVTEAKQSHFSSPVQNAPRLESLRHPFSDRGNCEIGDGRTGDSRPLPDVAMTGKCTRECDEYGHSDSCWMPVCTSPERRSSKSTAASTLPQPQQPHPQQPHPQQPHPQQPHPQQPHPQQPPKLSTFMSSGGGGGEGAGVQETLPVSVAASSAGVMMSGDPAGAAANGHVLGDRNRNTLSRKSSHAVPAAPSAYEVFGSPAYGGGAVGQGAGRGGEEVLHHPTEEIPLAPTGEYKPTSCGTLTRREVYL
ncbi:unnamed protein product [Boreogadus saida]